MAGGPFRPGDDPRRRRGRAEPNHRTAEIEELSKQIIERRGGVEGLLARFFAPDADPRLYLEAVKLVMGYAFGLPRQRVSVSGDAPVAVFITRSSAAGGLPEPAPAPADDLGRPDEIPGGFGGTEVGEDADGD